MLTKPIFDLPHTRRSKGISASARRWDSAVRTRIAQRALTSEFLSEGSTPKPVWQSRPNPEIRRAEAIRAVDEALESAEWILGLEDDFDGEGSVGYKHETWERLRIFLYDHVVAGLNEFDEVLTAPQINPAGGGSIDLFWETPTAQLLLNIPPTGPVATYYGKTTTGESIGGTIRLGDLHPEIVLWWVRNQ